MKVLFAVSSESISDAIIKKYQKEYKEILSYKNVYYFNAILKEIQRDKTYDRIVISEDLEPFSNNNYETIDKFIFEKLDGISDEAQDSQGKDTTIILICTDRHAKGSSFLSKIFSIGVYNALLGNDRSMDQVCQLINKPRSKKEAKLYYKIDQRPEDEGYNPETNEVSELEIQNILNHFKKLGKNTDRFGDSFNNIASQYTDEQLKIIINCLPITVKVILEEECQKYQEIMSVSGSINRAKATERSKEEQDKTGIKIDIIENKLNQPKMTGPIVIPSSVKTAGQNRQVQPRPVQKPVQPAEPVQRPAQPVQKPVQAAEPTQRPAQPVQRPVQAAGQTQRPVQPVKPPVKPVVEEEIVPEVDEFEEDVLLESFDSIVEEDTDLNSLLVGLDDEEEIEQTEEEEATEKIEDIEEIDDLDSLLLEMGNHEEEPEELEVEEEYSDEIIEEYNDELVEEYNDEAVEEYAEDMEETEFEVLDDELVEEVAEFEEDELIVNDKKEDVVLEVGYKDQDLLGQIDNLSVEQDGDVEDVEPIQEEPVKKGRGRPRKYFNVQPKPKGKRGRPRKIDTAVEEELQKNATLPTTMGESELNELNEILEQEDEDTILPGMFDNSQESETEVSELNELLEENEDTVLPGMLDEAVEEIEEYGEEASLPGLDELDDLDDLESFTATEEYEESETAEEYKEETMLPGMGFEDDLEEETVTSDYNQIDNTEETTVSGNNEYVSEVEEEIPEPFIDPAYEDVTDSGFDNEPTNAVESIKSNVDYSMSSLNSLITKDKKIVTFLGTTKNGTSFLINNLAALFSSLGINTAILDMTRNRNSYYIYTQNEEELRKIAYNSVEKLQNGFAEGIKVDKNLTVYTALPNDGKDYSDAEPILSTLVQSHSLILIDCDFDTNPSYFASCQEIYLVQSMDILTIQPLTAFLRELKTVGVLEPEKVRVVVNKEVKVRSLTSKVIIGGMSFYNDPAMSFMTELFNKDMVKACSIPFEENAYSKYLESMVNCNISINAYSKNFIAKLKNLADMVYPLTSKQTYAAKPEEDYSKSNFSNNMNDTLNQMKKNIKK